MTTAPAGHGTRRAMRRRRRTSSRATPVLVVLGALIGGVVFAYPLAAPWIADVVQGGVVVEYEQKAAGLDPAERERLLSAAHEYNENLPNGPLRDPYVINESGEAVSLEAGRAEYDELLRVDPDDPRAPMARLTIPRIDVDLPIFHGTDDQTLSEGVGHLYGSGLPVGGEGVHSVLTAHSGYVSSRLFDDVPTMRIGDTFTITVLGEVLTYRVDNIATTLPDDSELLRQVAGEDYVTLVTCTPRYVNTHRLLVRGERIPTPTASHDSPRAQTVGARDPGFPWWVLIAVGPAIAAGVLVRPRRRGAGDPEAG